MDVAVDTPATAADELSHRAQGVVSRIKHYYGPGEAELARYATHARNAGSDVALLLSCERRLENAVRRAGFVVTRAEARRAVVRGHVLVNGRKVIHPGYLVRVGDVLSVRPRPHIEALYRSRLATVVRLPGDWLRVEPAALRATVARLPTGTDVTLRADLTGLVDYLIP